MQGPFLVYIDQPPPHSRSQLLDRNFQSSFNRVNALPTLVFLSF